MKLTFSKCSYIERNYGTTKCIIQFVLRVTDFLSSTFTLKIGQRKNTTVYTHVI